MSSGYGQRGGGAAGGGGFEAPACVQNAMMTKDKKPFTYTPGGIDLSQIRSERMAKRLARNAQAEGATGASQQNRPSPQSPGASTSPGTAASAMGAAAMGMPFQVLPPPPPPPQPQSQSQGKNANNAGAPPPPPPQQQSTLAPPAGRGSAPGSPAAARKSPTPQRFEPPPLGFRPEIKIPPNPMAALRKVPPPVEKNTFWKDEYVKDRSKSPLPEPAPNGNNDYSNNNNVSQDAVDAYKPSGNASNYSNNYSNGNGNGNGNVNNNSYSPYTPPSSSPKTPPMQQQLQQPTPPATPPQQQQQQPQQQFRSVPMPQSPAVNVYTRQTESPRSPFELQQQQQRATESPFRFAQQQQQQQLQQQQPRPPTAISPLAQQQQQRPPTTISPLAQQQQQQQAASAVPWRTQRAPQQQQPTHPQQIYNNVPQQQQQQQQQQRSRDVFSPAKTEPATAAVYNTQQQQPYQGAKPTNVGSLYIAPLAQPTEPQAQRLLLQQQQQSGARDSPMRQMPQQQQQQQQVGGQPLRWLSSQPASKEQAPWARPEENGNVVPSTLRQATISAPTQNTTSAFYQPQMMAQGNGYARAASPGPVTQQNFGTNAPQTGLRLQITTNTNGNNANQSGGPREHIIPITLEQTPTYAAAQPNFGAPAGHIIRSANQFVDQGYNKYPATADTVNSPTQHHQQQPVLYNNNNNNMSNNTTRIIPIAIEGGRGGPISQSPVVLQNDPRSPPIQSKSFRILQKITDTVDDGSNDSRLASPQQQPHLDMEPPQLQRPQFARQMSAQQARNSPTIEQMRRLQIAQDQQPGTPQAWSPQGNGVSAQNRFTPQRSPYDTPQQQQQQYVPASEQQAFEPKKYTGSAIPSRSFKILQAMTTPENAGPGQSDL